MKKLIIFNQDYPYGHMEDSFLGLELPALREQFDVSMVALEMRDEGLEDASKQMYVISPVNSLQQKLATIPKTLFSGVFWREIIKILKTRNKVIGRMKDALMYMVAANSFYPKAVKKLGLSADTEAIFYFYWFDYRCLAFAMNMKKYPKCKIVSRTHGYELYDIRERYGLQLYKEFMDSKLDRLVFAAEFAKDYYLNRYGLTESKKYPVHRLGVASQEMTPDKRRNLVASDFSQSNTFTFLSCSGAIDIKRINLIIEGLSELKEEKIKIRWIHVGDGDRLSELKKLAKEKLLCKNGLSFEFKGFVDNKDLLDFYRNNCISAFITTTVTEGGCPVSIQEAMSFAIPSIGTAVGEIPLMLKNSGYVLPQTPEIAQISSAMQKLIDIYNTESYFELCEGALNTCKEMFDINRNNEDMVRELCGLTDF